MFQYVWSVSGGSQSLDLSGTDSRHLRLSPLTLSGGDAYAFSVTVIDESAPANESVVAVTGSAKLRLAEKGVVARLATKSVTVGTAAAAGLAIDGSLSADLDNRPGELRVSVLKYLFFLWSAFFRRRLRKNFKSISTTSYLKRNN